MLRLRSAIDFILLIPALLFLRAAGLLSPADRIAGYGIVAVSISLAAATFALGPSSTYYLINNVIVIVALVALAVRFGQNRPANEDFVVVRRGLLFFFVFALWDYVVGALSISLPHFEPFGFAGSLISLGYVAARPTLQRDQRLSDIQNELEVARRIQLSILPAEFPSSPHFQVAARYVPMNSVAGDFYDYVVADEQQAGLLIADVSGHGVPAALIASMVKLAAASQLSQLPTRPGSSPA